MRIAIIDMVVLWKRNLAELHAPSPILRAVHRYQCEVHDDTEKESFPKY